jgi:heterodisulfide reductase subunit B
MIKLRGEKFALFLGCTVPARCMNYEASARKVAEKLGVGFVDIPEFSCCGYPIKAISHDSFLSIAASNLAIAEAKGLDIVVLCSACGATLTKANAILIRDGDERKRINKLIEPLGRRYNGNVIVKHFARFLYEDIGLERIKGKVEKPLTGFKVAAHYGCHYLKPSDIFDGFDDPKMPRSLDALIEATGASSLNYIERKYCCGGGIVGVNEETAIKMSKRKLDFIKEAGVDAMVLICPFCDIMYEEYQASIQTKFGVQYDLPVLFLPQLLGLAFGFSPKELGFKHNALKPKALLERLDKGVKA